MLHDFPDNSDVTAPQVDSFFVVPIEGEFVRSILVCLLRSLLTRSPFGFLSFAAWGARIPLWPKCECSSPNAVDSSAQTSVIYTLGRRHS